MATAQHPISIEPMRSADLDAVFRIDRLCFPSPWLPSVFATELANCAASYLVARAGDEVVGFGGIWVIMGEAHVTTLAVEPSHRKRGTGERLLLALLEEGVLRGATRATLEVREGNRSAIGLYRKYGFYEAALRKSYYSDNGENALVMWADNVHTREYENELRRLRAALRAPHAG